MFKRAVVFILSTLSLVVAEALQHTEVFFIDFTQTPQNVQVMATWSFLMFFVVGMLYFSTGVYTSE